MTPKQQGGMIFKFKFNMDNRRVTPNCFRPQLQKNSFLMLPFFTARGKISFFANLSQTLNFAPAVMSELPPPPISCIQKNIRLSLVIFYAGDMYCVVCGAEHMGLSRCPHCPTVQGVVTVSPLSHRFGLTGSSKIIYFVVSTHHLSNMLSYKYEICHTNLSRANPTPPPPHSPPVVAR